MVALPYGSRPYPVDLGARETCVLAAPELPAPAPLDDLLDRALAAPIGAALPRPTATSRITVIVSDPTRHEPRAALLAALRRHFPDGVWTIAVATGTHGPCDLGRLGLAEPGAVTEGRAVINHDGHTDTVELGTTSRGTPVRVHRSVLDADLVLATGCIRPHYFAGFGAGAKALFPGLGEAAVKGSGSEGPVIAVRQGSVYLEIGPGALTQPEMVNLAQVILSLVA